MKNESGNSPQFFEELRALLNPVRQDNIQYLYDYTDEGNRRWSNLVGYLEYMRAESPDTLMIGEAPGYRGTSVSGVPFLSEQMIELRRQKNLRLPVNNYIVSKEEGAPSYEATSTIMWSVLDQHIDKKLPLLWATLPNHPHRPGVISSNRKPSKQEIRPYLKAIELLITQYTIKRVVAIGNVAHDTLIKSGYNDITKIRHPARGGARKFTDGYARLTKEKYGEY